MTGFFERSKAFFEKKALKASAVPYCTNAGGEKMNGKKNDKINGKKNDKINGTKNGKTSDKKKRGKFIVFEGIDGSGKSTQIEMFKNRLEAAGVKCHVTREPTDSPVGALIRQVLKGRMKTHNKVLAPMFVADRLDHILNDMDGIKKMLDSGINVICDRYYFSSYAYHSVDMDMDWVINANSVCADILRPDCTVFIDVSPETAMERISSGRTSAELFETKERLELVREKYMEAFEKLDGEEKIIFVNGDNSRDRIAENIWYKVSHLFAVTEHEGPGDDVMLYPMSTNPVFKQYLWGGSNIRALYLKDTPDPPVAESWEISAHPDGLCHIANGRFRGKTIDQVSEELGEDFYGKSIKKGEKFPLLLKILDAADRLSIQVHPNDEYAAVHENGEKGKTEAWYILRAEDDAKLIYGFKKDANPKDFEKALKDGDPEKYLNFVPCHEGDVFYIPAGTVHAVGKGLLIAEIQQSSDTTYRVFDYNRRDKDGNLRPLHIKKALDVLNFSSSEGREKVVPKRRYAEESIIDTYIDNEFFVFEKIYVENEFTGYTEDRLHMLFVARGGFSIGDQYFEEGTSVLIPAGLKRYTLKGDGRVLRYYVR